jgi:predicted TIM-barrel fold metal-dependent hydrolase
MSGRIIHDADSHLMELPDVLDPWLDPKFRAAYDALPKLAKREDGYVGKARTQQPHPAFRESAGANIMLRKNYEAMGAFLKSDRPRALDQLGFASQLVFTTWCLNNFGLERPDQAELAYATATAHNRMMADFCSIDRRFLGTAYIPLIDIGRAIACAKDAIAMGAKALLIPSRPQGRSASHLGHDPIWAMAQEAGLPILFHVGDEKKLDPQYFENGLPRVKVLTEDLKLGDFERAFVEWRSLLRHITWAPDLAWERWRGLKAEAARMLERTERVP